LVEEVRFHKLQCSDPPSEIFLNDFYPKGKTLEKHIEKNRRPKWKTKKKSLNLVEEVGFHKLQCSDPPSETSLNDFYPKGKTLEKHMEKNRRSKWKTKKESEPGRGSGIPQAVMLRCIVKDVHQ